MINVLNNMVRGRIKKDCSYNMSNGRLKKLRELTDSLSRHDRELANLEAEYKNIVERATDIIILTKPDGIIAYISKNCKDILGYEYHELINHAYNFMHPDDKNKADDCFGQALGGAAGTGIKYRLLTKSGETKEIAHSWAPVFVNSKLYLITSIIRPVIS